MVYQYLTSGSYSVWFLASQSIIMIIISHDYLQGRRYRERGGGGRYQGGSAPPPILVDTLTLSQLMGGGEVIPTT